MKKELGRNWEGIPGLGKECKFAKPIGFTRKSIKTDKASILSLKLFLYFSFVLYAKV